MRRLTEPRRLAVLTLLLLIGSPAWGALIDTPIRDTHQINTGRKGSTVGYTTIYVTSEGLFNVRARTAINVAQGNPYLYLFEGTRYNLGRQVEENDNSGILRDNNGFNSLIRNVFLAANNYYTAVVSDIFSPGKTNFDFTEAEARAGSNEIREGRFGRIRVIFAATRRNAKGTQEYPGPFQPDAYYVPEPGVLGLLGAGLIAGCAVKRRRRLAVSPRGVA